MAESFDCTPDNISLYLKNICGEGKLLYEATGEKISVVQKEENRDVKRNCEFYNFDAIIFIGYRVNSIHATQFCKWATSGLKKYIIKEFAIDDE